MIATTTTAAVRTPTTAPTTTTAPAPTAAAPLWAGAPSTAPRLASIRSMRILGFSAIHFVYSTRLCAWRAAVT